MTLRPPFARAPALCFALVLAASAAAAQPAPEATAQARAAFERGVAEARAEHFASAATAFEESYQLRHSVVVLYNLAAAYSRLGHDRRAIETYERYLAEGGATLGAERIRVVNEALAGLRREIATVALRINPAGASIEVDGRVETPTDNVLQLDPGPHVVTFSAAERRPLRQELQLAPGSTRVLDVNLDPVAPPVAPVVAPVVVAPDLRTPHPAVVAAPAPVRVDGPASPGIASRWWFWTGLAVVAAGVTVGVLAATGAFTSDESPRGGTAYNISAIHWQ